jgi:tripartite-type tricarboxylate transporter receptor subunit TctC
MSIDRLRLPLRLLAAIAACMAARMPSAPAQTTPTAYPTKPVRVVVPSAPGGGTDLIARYVAQVSSERWGQTVVTDNRSGGATTIGINIVAKSLADGYTLLLTTTNFAFLPAVHAKLPYDPVNDFTPIVRLATSDSLISVHPDVAAKNVSELIALARSRPGEIRYASGGTGTVGHLTSALFSSVAKVNLMHVPYKGTGPGIVAVSSGEVHLLIANIATLLPQVKARRLRALAMTGSRRSKAVPDLPTAAEAGLPGFEYSGWYGLWAPARTPGALVRKLNGDFNRVVKAPQFSERFQEAAIEPVGGSEKEFSDYVAAELRKWVVVAKEAGLKPE